MRDDDIIGVQVWVEPYDDIHDDENRWCLKAYMDMWGKQIVIAHSNSKESIDKLKKALFIGLEMQLEKLILAFKNSE